MMNTIRNFFGGRSRSALVKKNALASFLLKGIDGLIYLLIVPATLGFLDKYSYGIWLTINSIFVWINSFDIGLGNGLRNCLAKALAIKDYEKARVYISTTYFLLFLLVSAIYILFYTISYLINWYEVLNVAPSIIPNLNDVINYSFFFFGLTFLLKILGNVYMALQYQAVSNLFHALGYILSLVLIIAARYTFDSGDLMIVALIFAISPCLIYIISTPLTYGVLHKKLRPSIKFIKLKGTVNDLLTVGVKFFLMQICVLILFFTSNVVISNLFGPDQVTPYNIASRYMHIGILISSTILSPIWSAVTDAQARGDMLWIKKTIKRVDRIVLIIGLLLILLCAVSTPVYHMWIGSSVTIPFAITCLNAVYIYLLIWSSSQSTFLNGLGVLNLQLTVNVFQAIIYSKYFKKY